LAGNDEQRDSAVASSAGDPGPLSRLLQELADAPGGDALETWKSELRAGDRVGRFEIRREVGRGGFGAVYEALDTELNRVVAVKALRLSRPRRELSADWIKKEAEAVARLDHPCIVTLFDVGTCPSGPYLVMELLRGRTLAQRIADGPIPLDEALRIAEEMAKGLAHAHQRGVLHRDLKPANTFLCDDGRVKLLDFGLAHLLGTEGESSGGTPAYMAPEQWTGASGTAASDVFAMGVLLYRMFTGALPFSEADGTRDATATTEAPPLPRSAGPRPLRELVARCLSLDPAKRPADGTAVLEVLTEARRAFERRKAIRGIRRAASALLLVGLAVLASFITWRRGEPPRPAIPVVVADFENTTGDPVLDALSGLLITSLQQSRRLAVLPRGRALEIARASRGGEVSRVDEATGREVARRTSTRTLMLPTVRKFGDTYVVELQGVEPGGDRVLFAVEERGQGKASLPDLVDRLSDRAREALHERAEEVERSQVHVGRAVTSDLGAYDQYFRGQQLLGEGKDGEALAAFRRAVEIEPEFALAHLAAAAVLEGSDPDGSRLAIAAAVRHMDRVPEKDRLLIQAWNAALQYRTEDALPYLEEVQRRWPEDPDGWTLAGHWIATHRGDWTRALPLLERGASLDAARTPSVIRAQLLSHRLDDALRTALRFVEERPGIPSLVLLTLVHSHRGETEKAAEAARRALQMGASLQEPILHALIRAGALDEAETAARAWSAPSREEIHRRDAYVSRAVIRAVEGRQREALAIVDETAADLDGGKPAPYTLWVRSFLLGGGKDADGIYRAAKAQQKAGFLGATCASMLLADLGDAGRAEELARGAERTPCARISRAVTAWRRGDRQAAITDLQGVDLGTDRYYLARALLDSGRDEEAAIAFRDYYTQQTGWMPFFAWSYPQSLYLEASARERLGEVGEARRLLRALLDLWKRADPATPHLQDARSLAARLGVVAP
jgi:tetratricopeptide (TPR) repeat protein